MRTYQEIDIIKLQGLVVVDTRRSNERNLRIERTSLRNVSNRSSYISLLETDIIELQERF